MPNSRDRGSMEWESGYQGHSNNGHRVIARGYACFLETAHKHLEDILLRRKTVFRVQTVRNGSLPRNVNRIAANVEVRSGRNR